VCWDLGPPCGRCNACTGSGTGRPDIAHRRRTALALRFLNTHGHLYPNFATLAAQSQTSNTAANAQTSAAAVSNPSTSPDLDIANGDTGCPHRRRIGRVDDKGKCLNSNDTKDAFERAIHNAKYTEYPPSAPMTLPKLYRDGTPQLDSKGFELSFSQHGTNFAENTFGRAERVMSAHGGYNADVFSALGYEFA